MGKLTDFTKKDRYSLGFESSDGSAYAHVTSENVELEVEPNEVNLSSFKIKDSLQRKFWKDGDTLDLVARQALLNISDDFWEACDVHWVKPKGIILTGSICNYNWSEFSDIDLHLIVDFKEIHERTDFVKEYFNEKKNDWNNTHNQLKIYGFPVELYVQDVHDEVESGGLYDLNRNRWIKEPNQDFNQLSKMEKRHIKSMSAKIMTKIDDLINAFGNEEDKHKIELISKKIDKLSQSIKKLRSDSLEEDGEMSVGNICYKVLRRSGYLDKMWDLSTKCYDKINSLEECKSFEGRIREMF